MAEEQSPRPDRTLPFAIAPHHAAAPAEARWRTPLAALVIGGVIVAAFTGLLGGAPSRTVRASGEGVAAELTYDPIVRSGNWFETTMSVRAERRVQDLTVAVDHALWRAMSIDTIAPDAESAEALDGRFTYHFGEVKPGEVFRLKFDGQIQAGMMRRQSGSIEVRDGERKLLAIPLGLTVLP